MKEVLSRPGSMGSDGLRWWIGQVAPRSAWAGAGLLINDKSSGRSDNKPEQEIYYNRVKVKVVGFHDKIADPNDLPWAHVVNSPNVSSGYGFKDSTHYLEGGESVFGFWLDGEDEQKPVILGVFYRNSIAEDLSQPLKGSAATPTNGAAVQNNLDQKPTGGTASTNVATGETTPETTTSYNPKYNLFTGISEDKKVVRPHISNEASSQKGTSDAAEAHHTFLGVKTSRPTCKRDNSIAEITGLLGDFSEFLLTAQGYANFYVNLITNTLINLDEEIKLIAKSITKIMTSLYTAIRDEIFAEIAKKIQEFINEILPEEVKPLFGDSIKGTVDTIYCIFENLIEAILNIVVDLLLSLVGQFVNGLVCAAEQLTGALLNSLLDAMEQAISPILQSLNETLGGALGSVNQIINQALEAVGIVYSFIGCDKFKCPLPSRFDNAYGPTQAQKDSAQSIFSSISILNIQTSTDEDGNSVTVGDLLSDAEDNAASIFGPQSPEDQALAAQVNALAGGCNPNILVCGPPTIEIFGGEGFGGAANAVVNELGQVIGADIVEAGFGYSSESPPYVTVKDACSEGKGAKATAIIDDESGEIIKILIDNPGYNYPQKPGKIITSTGIIPVTQDPPEEAIIDKIAQIDDVIVTNPGYGYNPGDTIQIDGVDLPDGLPILEPVIVGGKIVDVKIQSPGYGFTEIPPLTINSDTGIGADFSVVLKFVNVDELIEPIDPAKIIQVINCVGK